MSPDAYTMLANACTLLTVVFSSAWYLSNKLAMMASQLESHTKMVNQRFERLERDIQTFDAAIKDAALSREQIWQAISELREKFAEMRGQIERS